MSVLDGQPGGEIQIRESFECSQTELWNAISDPIRLSTWLGGRCFIEPLVGGAVLFHLHDDDVLAAGVVRSYEPPRTGYRTAGISHTFIDATRPGLTSVCAWYVTITGDDSCELRFSHDGMGEVDLDKFGAAWRKRLGLPVREDAAPRVHTSPDDALKWLRSTRSIVLISFVGPEVPTTLLRAGFEVTAKVGPAPGDWAKCSLSGDDLVTTPAARPSSADLMHLDVGGEFEEYLATAKEMGAKTFWYHSATTAHPAPADSRGCWLPAARSARQRAEAEAAGMSYIDDLYIADVARSLVE